MSFEEVVEKMKEIQNALLGYLEDETEATIKYEIFVNFLNNQKIKEDRWKLGSLLKMINFIGKKHHRNNFFNEKIDKILCYLRNEIQRYFTNKEIFDFFLKLNKRTLLFLIEEKILIIDEYIASRFTYHHSYTHKYCEYFFSRS